MVTFFYVSRLKVNPIETLSCISLVLVYLFAFGGVSIGMEEF